MAFTARESLSPLYRTVIEELRHERQETQAQLAARCGLSRGVISRLENGNGVGPKTAKSLAKAFGRDVRALFTGSRALRKADIPRRWRRHTSLVEWQDLLRREAVENPMIRVCDVNLLLAPHTAAPAIVYLYYDLNDWDATELRYAELDPTGQWVHSRITNRVTGHSVYANFVVTATGQVCGLFSPEGGSPGSPMVYGGRADGVWSFQSVPGYTQGDHHLLRLDGKGRPHIIYNRNRYRREPGDPLSVPPQRTASILYLYYAAAEDKWYTEAVDPATTHADLMFAHDHFQLDNQSQPYVAYTDYDLAGHTQLKLAHRATDGQWSIQTIWPIEGPPTNERPEITYTVAAVALDPQGQPSILCFADTPRFVLLLLFSQVDGRWAFEKIPMAWQPGSPLRCAYDQFGRLHIVVTALQYDGEDDSRGPYFACDPTSTQTGGIFYVYQADDWVIERIAEEPYGSDVAFALDERGQPHVAFSSHGHGGLWYATRKAPGTWNRTRVDG